MKKIAIVGGGIFGVSCAWTLAKNGYFVDLYDKNKDIFSAASGINQFRLHRGYHYPRSIETILSCIKGEKDFKKVYTESILDSGEHYYCIAKKGTLSTTDQCLKVWDENNLEYDVVESDLLNKDNVELCVKVKESLLDPIKFKEICWNRLKKYGVNVILNTEVKYNDLNNYDLVVIATYSLNNSLLDKFPEAQRNYQFELCEKLVLKLPDKFKDKSIVVIDGPFCCIDPFGRTGLSLMGNVVHAIHKTNIGKLPDIPDKFKELLNNGIIKNPPVTNFRIFIEYASEFFLGIEKAEHIGSMYTVRTVLPYREHDDARPTIVEQIDDRVVVILSGKIPTCIDVTKQVLNICKEKWGEEK